jgi:hypothetical protein
VVERRFNERFRASPDYIRLDAGIHPTTLARPPRTSLSVTVPAHWWPRSSSPPWNDAVQEGWLRLSRTDTSAIENLRGWLTTVVARVCLDILRSRNDPARLERLDLTSLKD